MEHNSSLVNLSIPENVTKPIIAAKIQEAITIAMGGADRIISGVVKQICETKVNPTTGKLDTSYSSNNTMPWIDFHITQLLQDAIKEELGKQVREVAGPVKDELIKQLQSKKGAQQIATALLSSLAGSFGSEYTSKVEVKFESKNARSGY